MPRNLLHLMLLAGIALLAASVMSTTAAAAPSTSAGSVCTRYAAPTGKDSSQGTQAAPYKTAQKLVDSLSGGQVGCLRAGSYVQDVTISRAQITLTAYAGEQATLVGRLWIKEGANGVLVTGLQLNGKNAKLLPSPTVNADDTKFVANDITNDNTEICLMIGSSWGRAERTRIEGNRIHHCGKLPAQNEDHGIYIGEADDTQILHNVIYSNADRGIQLYPDAQRTVIRDNVIDGNGVGIIFSGADGVASNNTVVERNVISNSNSRANVESYYPAGNPIGVNNVVRDNCVGRSAARSPIQGSGFTATSNVVVSDPGYANRAAGDFRLTASSPCAAMLRSSNAPADLAWDAPLTNGGEPTSGDNTPGGQGPDADANPGGGPSSPEGADAETPDGTQPDSDTSDDTGAGAGAGDAGTGGEPQGDDSGAAPSDGDDSGAAPSDDGAAPTDGDDDGAAPTDGDNDGAAPTDGDDDGAAPTDGDDDGAAPTDAAPVRETPRGGSDPRGTRHGRAAVKRVKRPAHRRTDSRRATPVRRKSATKCVATKRGGRSQCSSKRVGRAAGR